jgi:hypothetical protein
VQVFCSHPLLLLLLLLPALCHVGGLEQALPAAVWHDVLSLVLLLLRPEQAVARSVLALLPQQELGPLCC